LLPHLCIVEPHSLAPGTIAPRAVSLQRLRARGIDVASPLFECEEKFLKGKRMPSKSKSKNPKRSAASQARQFYKSQTPTEQNHLANALVFELSKVETPAIRSRMVAHLLNIDKELANQVAEGLGLKEMPKPAEAARPTEELKPSPALSIHLNGPESFKGRKVGALLTDGVDVNLFHGLKAALQEEGALLEIIAPKVGGVQASDGSRIEAKQKLDGGPSVLYDAVALLPSAEGVKLLAKEPAARDFVADAFAHMKFIGHTPAAADLFQKAGVAEEIDEGFIALNGKADCAAFITACRKLRYWQRTL
jgi:catalase